MDDALPPVDIEALLGEIERYLAAVDAFREAGCEPCWRHDVVPSTSPRRKGAADVLRPATEGRSQSK